jgi:hypothetical protein
MHNWSFARVDVDYLGKKQNSYMDKSILTLKVIIPLARHLNDDKIGLILGENLRET